MNYKIEKAIDQKIISTNFSNNRNDVLHETMNLILKAKNDLMNPMQPVFMDPDDVSNPLNDQQMNDIKEMFKCSICLGSIQTKTDGVACIKCNHTLCKPCYEVYSKKSNKCLIC